MDESLPLNIVISLLDIHDGRKGMATRPAMMMTGISFIFQKNTNTSTAPAIAIHAPLEPVLNSTRTTGARDMSQAAFFHSAFSLIIIEMMKGTVSTSSSP